MVQGPRRFRGQSDVQLLMEAHPSTVIAVDGDGLIGYLNPSGQRSLGYGADELVGQPVEVLVPAAMARGHVQQRTDYRADPFPRPMGTGRELAVRRKDGSEFPVEISLTPLVTCDGPWVLATVVDISARRQAAAQLEAANRSYRMLAHTNQAIVRAASVAALYADVCRVVVEDGGYAGAWVAQHRSSGDLEMVAAAGVLDDYIGGLRISSDAGAVGGRGPIAVALRENRPVYHVDTPDASPMFASSASLPLRVRGVAAAVLTIYSEQAEGFDALTCDLLQGMADNVSFGLGQFAATTELDIAAARSSELVRRLVRAQEDERSRIAANVHDDSVQSLAVVDLRLGLLRRRLEGQGPELLDAVRQIQESVGSVGASLRLLLFELEPTDSVMTIPEMLVEAAGVIFEAHDVRWKVEVDSPPELATVRLDASWLPEPNRTQVVRVAKEALVNVRKHSGAGNVLVTVRPDQLGVEVSVIDDGVGIDPAVVRPAPGHRGLTTMRERVEISGGWTQLEGGPAGTTVRFWVPRVWAGADRAR